MNPDIKKLRGGLASVYWLGGMSRAGKSTTAGLLARRSGLVVIARDDYIQEHWARATPEAFPAMCRAKRIVSGDRPEWTEFAEGPVSEAVEDFW